MKFYAIFFLLLSTEFYSRTLKKNIITINCISIIYIISYVYLFWGYILVTHIMKLNVNISESCILHYIIAEAENDLENIEI